jgi:cytochrome c oxidase assembly factor CtaG
MAAFWVGIVLFWVFFILAAPTGPQLVLRVALLVITAGLYLALRRERRGDQVEPLPQRVLWLPAAVAALSAGSVFFYSEPAEKAASALMAFSMIALLIANLPPRD